MQGTCLERDALDDMKGVDDVAERLGHLAAMGIAHHGMEIHLLEGNLACSTMPAVNALCVGQSYCVNKGCVSQARVRVVCVSQFCCINKVCVGQSCCVSMKIMLSKC